MLKGCGFTGAAVFKGCGPHLLEHDSLAVGRAAKRVALELSAQVRLLIALLRPPLLATHGTQLARRVDSTRLACGGHQWGRRLTPGVAAGGGLSGLHSRRNASSRTAATREPLAWAFLVPGRASKR